MALKMSAFWILTCSKTPHGESEAFAPTVRNVRASYIDKPLMPVIDGEASYEMLMDKTPPDWPRAMFWICMLSGAAGHTYGANGIWQCNRREQPHGPVASWRHVWQNVPGTKRCIWPVRATSVLAKSSSRNTSGTASRPIQNGPRLRMNLGHSRSSILDGFGSRRKNQLRIPPQKRDIFESHFFCLKKETITRARLLVSADEPLEVRVNGRKIGAARDWHIGKEFNELAPVLKSGSNVLACIGETKHAGVSGDPPGFIACLEVRFESTKPLILVSDATWHCNKNEQPQRDETGFKDLSWTNATEVAHFGEQPWGKDSRGQRPGRTAERWHREKSANNVGA
jgi:hypothetical protein